MKNKMMALLMAVSIWACSFAICSASDGRLLVDEVGVDRFAHMGLSYVINDQLKRNCGMNDFWAAFTTLAIGAAKEIWIDKNWDNGDFAADCAGVALYQIKF